MFIIHWKNSSLTRETVLFWCKWPANEIFFYARLFSNQKTRLAKDEILDAISLTSIKKDIKIVKGVN